VSAAKKIILLLWLVIVASLGNASALTPGTTETCVGEKTFETLATRQAEPLETAGRHQENGSRSYEVAPDSLLAAKAAKAAEEGVQTLDASAIRFSQSSVNNVGEIADSMAANGWKGSPVTVVRMADGSLTTVDNTRVLAAGLTGTPVQATIFDAGASIDASQAIRFVGPNGGLPTTWGEAVLNRIGNQNSLYRATYPSGSPVTGLSSW
jgi:hypothetical protein